MKRLLLGLVLFALALAVAPRAALAYTPPPMTAHVTDTAGVLTEAERLAIDKKLEDYRLETTNEIAVFLPKSLEGEDIEDVGIQTARAWKLGVKGKDNGVLLIIAPVERKARIEVGKGVEGSLTDLQSNDIIRRNIRPHLARGHERYAAAVSDATGAIMATLSGGPGASRPARPAPPPSGSVAIGLVMLLIVFGIPILIFILVLTKIGSVFSSGGGSGWASGSSWSSGDSGFSGGGDSGFSGGGGDFGGGGSSDSF